MNELSISPIEGCLLICLCTLTIWNWMIGKS